MEADGMTTLRDAAQQALEALIAATPVKAKDPQMQADAIVALRAALAEPAEQQWCACEPTECKGVGRCRWQAMSYSPLDKQPAEQEPKNAE
ncbi:MAG: hypothetical protein ACYCXC_00060 [Acidovorax defluvii]